MNKFIRSISNYWLNIVGLLWGTVHQLGWYTPPVWQEGQFHIYIIILIFTGLVYGIVQERGDELSDKLDKLSEKDGA